MNQPALRAEQLAVLVLAAFAGAAVAGRPEIALLLVAATALLIALGLLREAAFAASIAFAVALPYFPMGDGVEADPVIPGALLPAAVGLAVAVPYGASLLTRRSVIRPSRTQVLLAVVVAMVAFLTLASREKEAVTSLPNGSLLVGIAAYLAAWRFPDPTRWLFPSVVALAVLLGFGAAEWTADPSERIGWFTGYPILYSALVVGLLPAAMVWARARSGALLGFIVAASVIAVLLSQTRSAWLAVVMMALMLVALLVRQRLAGWIALFVAGALAIGVGVATSDDLSEVVSSRLSSQILTTDPVTHREFSYGYTWERFSEQPLFGRGHAGALKEDIEERTGLNASDNGFLSLAGDLGLLGIVVALLPVAVAVGTLRRHWARPEAAPAAVAMAFGLVGILIVTLFFDSHYWPQSAALMFGMTGVLLAHGRLERQADG